MCAALASIEQNLVCQDHLYGLLCNIQTSPAYLDKDTLKTCTHTTTSITFTLLSSTWTLCSSYSLPSSLDPFHPCTVPLSFWVTHSPPFSLWQAWQMNDILLQHTCRWARESNGSFLLTKTGIIHGCSGVSTYVRYKEATQDQLKLIRWAKIKSTDRAVEKILRAYAQVSKKISCP